MLQLEALQPGERQHRSVNIPRLELAKTGLDIATEDLNVEVRAQLQSQRLAAERRRSELGALWQIFQPLYRATDENIADVFALQIDRNLQSIGKNRRHVLGGVNRKVDAVVVKRFFQFLGEKALAASFRQGAVLYAVARRADDYDLECFFRKVVGSHQACARLRGLRQRQCASARSNSHQIGLHVAMSVLTPPVR